MNESEKLRTIACYLPLVSLFVRNPNELGKLGRIASNWFTVLFLVIISLGFTEISQLALSSLYIFLVVSLGVFIFLNKEPTFLRLVAFLPKKKQFRRVYIPFQYIFGRLSKQLLEKEVN